MTVMMFLLFLMAAAFGGADPGNADLDESQTIEHTFPGATKLLVDNIQGSIRVTGVAGDTIHMKAQEKITAESAEAMAEAKRDVKLDLSTQGSFARVYEDGPFREHDRGRRFYGYRVSFDYDIQVPFGTELILKTVNGGEVSVKGTSGPFEVGNVNGGITLDEIGGSGSVRTVNGPVKVWFTKNPTKPSTFHTINGGVEVHFQPSLGADLKFKTMNGQIYTDFDVTALPAATGTTENKDGRFVYKGNKTRMGRAGGGGPELSFETLNGDIKLRTGK
jgi:hypothetical protein